MVDNEYKKIFGDFDFSEFDGKLCFDKVSNIDLILSNIIYKNDEIYIIDYEWVFNCGLPVEYTLYRTLKYNSLLKEREYLEKYKDLEEFFITKYVYSKSFYKYKTQFLKKKRTVDSVIHEYSEKLMNNELFIQEQRIIIEQKENYIQEQRKILSTIQDAILYKILKKIRMF
jgi:hypothetical protein